MKIKQILFTGAVAAILPVMSFKIKPGKVDFKEEKGTYCFVFVRGLWTESHHALISRVIYRPPYPECKEGSAYREHAIAGFAKYLAAYNDDEKFSRSNISLNDNFSSRQKAQDALDEVIAKEKEAGHTVKQIEYTYSCQY